MPISTEHQTPTEDITAIFVYYTNSKNPSRDDEILKRFKANFPAQFRIILIQTTEAEKMECIYPRYLVADDLAEDLKGMGDYLRTALQLESADDAKKQQLLKALGYVKEPAEE